MTAPRIVRRGDGDVVPGEHWLFKAVASNTGGLFDFMVGPVERFTGPPLHVHAEQSDTFLVLEGHLTIQIVDEMHELGPGDFATVPPGVPHTFDNVQDGGEQVLAVNVMVPGGLHAFFEKRAEVGDGASREELRGLAETFGMTVVGPPLRTTLGVG
ncbi:cupin domain-containing protein [Kribbella sp. NBC_01484]|uniref:cupin domain-containing protein n=1 Tax=Kribbella sp. NBC_01484 TaxID=2903579 RepID=UPI002E329552|nr:cupin domain-containing protein [Kribbella sp. NBC_01484]